MFGSDEPLDHDFIQKILVGHNNAKHLCYVVRAPRLLQLFIGSHDHSVNFGGALGVADLVKYFRLLD